VTLVGSPGARSSLTPPELCFGALGICTPRKEVNLLFGVGLRVEPGA
jgi:hypothetical protein